MGQYMYHRSHRLTSPKSCWLKMFICLFCCLCGSYCGEIRSIPDLPNINFSRPGNLTIGVVSTLHKYDPNSLCGDVVRELGALQRLEAIVFAMEEINNRSDILPGLTLGFTIVDDCYNDLTALARALHFIQRDAGDESDSTSKKSDSLPSVSAVAVIGAEGSPRTLAMADVFSLFRVPLLSYASSSILLDDKKRFPYFSRTVPSDSMQVQALVDIVVSFGWTYVSILYARGSYGREAYRAIRYKLERKGFCLAVTESLENSFTDIDYENIIHKLLIKPQARVVVLFTTNAQALRLFQTLKRQALQDEFTWVGSDSIAMNPQDYIGLETVIHGSLSVNFISSPVPRFEEHFKRMTLRTGSRNPWFGEFLSEAFGCSLNKNALNTCDEDREIQTANSYLPESTTAMSMNAVYAWAHALDDIIKNCPEREVNKCVTPQGLRNTLRRVSFLGEGGNISFDADGNGQACYEIRNMALDGGVLVTKVVGMWDTITRNFTFLNKDQIRWKASHLSPATRDQDTDAYPRSVCSEPCRAGEQLIPLDLLCCFECEPCRENERTVTLNSGRPKCEKCPTADNFTWPDEETRTECLPLVASYLLTVDQTEGLLILVVDNVVFVITCTIIVLFIKNASKRLIKASSAELSLVMLAGHVITCMVVLLFIFVPTDLICSVICAGFHMSFTLSYGPLLVKTNRIYRIFMSGKKRIPKPPMVSSNVQLGFVAGIVVLQGVVTSISIGVDPPAAQTVMPIPSEQQVFRECLIHKPGFLVPLCFNLLLMTACAGHAFISRTLPTNFNEAKFICFAIFSTAILWLSFLPMYFTATEHSIKALCLAVALIFNLLSIQMFLFLPKLYAIFCVTEDKMNMLRETPIQRSHIAGQNAPPASSVQGLPSPRNVVIPAEE